MLTKSDVAELPETIRLAEKSELMTVKAPYLARVARAAWASYCERDMLRELLAVIHRDGGHYTEEHGIAKSCADAMTKVSELIHKEQR